MISLWGWEEWLEYETKLGKSNFFPHIFQCCICKCMCSDSTSCKASFIDLLICFDALKLHLFSLASSGVRSALHRHTLWWHLDSSEVHWNVPPHLCSKSVCVIKNKWSIYKDRVLGCQPLKSCCPKETAYLHQELV